MDPAAFDRESHVAFLEMMLERLPEDYESQEINRLTMAYFVISSLAVLDALDRVNKDQLVSWVLSFQVHPRNDADLKNGKFYGFGGSTPSNTFNDDERASDNNCSHLASTYCALAILKVVGYGFLNCNFEPILVSMRELQLPDGSFMPIHTGAEADIRFLYCAAAICFMLSNWTGMDKVKAREFILKCQSYDGGFGLVPGAESHGGATYCAVAALHLMGYMETGIISKFSQPCVIDTPLVVEWSLQRQSFDGGFHGRANKPSDTCYAFWVGGVLKLLGGYHFCNKEALRSFLLSCQSKFGGFKKFADIIYPDLYHSFYGFSALSLLEEPGLKPLQMKEKLAALTFAERCKNILAANCQAYLNTIKADAKGSKDDIHTSKIHYMFKKGKPYIWVKEGDLHNVNVIIDERGSLAVSAVVPGSITRLLRSMGKAPARVALAGDVIPLKDVKVQALGEGLRQHLQKGENYASHSSYAVSAILSSASINCKSRIETFQEILDKNSNYVAHKFNISYVDGSGNIHDVEVEDVQAPKADLLFPFAEKLIDGINQSQPRRRALMLFCLEYYNAHARDALMLSIDQYGFDVIAKVPESMASNAQSLQYVWKEFRFSFKEEANDLETFCNLLVGLEEEVLQSVRSYSGLY